MEAKELLKPRFELIANYPGCVDHNLVAGDIVSFDHYYEPTNQWYNDDGKTKIYDAYYEGFPHLFRKLNWWEKRNKEDMPKKLICKAIENDTEIMEIQEWDMDILVGWLDKKKRKCCSLQTFNPKYGYFPVD